MMTCTNRNDQTQRRVISMLDEQGVDIFSYGKYGFGKLCESAKKGKANNSQCDLSNVFCFTPEHGGKCTFDYMPYKEKMDSEPLKGNKQKTGKVGQSIIMEVSSFAFTNPVTAVMAAEGTACGLTARSMMQKKCKRHCIGCFLDQADKLGINGKIDCRSDVQFVLSDAPKNHQCFCEYNGSLHQIPTHHMVNQCDERNYDNCMKISKKNKNQKTMCLTRL